MWKHRYIFLLWVGSPMMAYGHSGEHLAEGFLNGLLHPLLGADHLLSLLAVGWWAALVGRQAIWRLPVLFLLAMISGLGVTIMGDGIPVAIETLLALSVLWLGWQVASNRHSVPLPTLAVMVLFAFVHGYSHKAVTVSGADEYLWYALGLLVTSGILQMVGIWFGSYSRQHRLLRLWFGLGCSGMGVLFLAGI